MTSVLQGVDLSAISYWRIGGRAELVLRLSSTAEVAALRRWFYKRGLPHVVVGKEDQSAFCRREIARTLHSNWSGNVEALGYEVQLWHKADALCGLYGCGRVKKFRNTLIAQLYPASCG